MIRLLTTLGLIALLGACGVDGEPTQPDPRPEPGVTITGTVEVGISG